MPITKLTKDEAAQRSTDVENGTVRCVRTVKPDADSPVRYVVDWTLNFADVEQNELLELASRALVIDTQREWRSLPDNQRLSDAWAKRTISVRDVLDRERTRGPVDRVKATTNLIGKMTPEELEQIKALLK